MHKKKKKILSGAGSMVRAKLETLETSLNQGILRLFKHYKSKGRRGGGSFLLKTKSRSALLFFIHKSKNRNKTLIKTLLLLFIIIVFYIG